MAIGDPFRVNVSVTANFSTEAVITPLSFVWEDERRYSVDRVLDIRRAASLKTGGGDGL